MQQPPPPLQQIPYQDQHFYRQQNGHHSSGKASFIIAMSIIVLYIAQQLISNYMLYSYDYAYYDTYITITLCIVGFEFLLAITGMILGIVGAGKRDYKKGLAITGIVLNSIFVLLFCFSLIAMMFLFNSFGRWD